MIDWGAQNIYSFLITNFLYIQGHWTDRIYHIFSYNDQ